VAGGCYWLEYTDLQAFVSKNSGDGTGYYCFACASISAGYEESGLFGQIQADWHLVTFPDSLKYS
jgi:hypothetical protein